MVDRRVRLERLLALGGILFVALYTRLYRLDLIDFKADEALIAGLARDVLAGKWPAASIQTSLGPFNPPLFVYLLAAPMHFSTNPAVLAGLVAALDAVAVFATYLVGTRVFGRVAGTTAALFYAADPYATIFSRKLAGTFVEPLIAICLLGCLFVAIGRRGRAGEASGRSRASGPAKLRGWRWQAAWFGSAFCLLLLLQLHPATALLAPVVLLAWALWGRRAALPGLVLGALAGAATFVPYLLFEFQRQPRFLHTLLGAAGGTAHWDARSLYLVWVLVSSGGYSDVTGPAAGAYRAATPVFSWLPLLIGLAVAAGLPLAMARWRDRRYALLLLFVLLPVGLTVRHSVGVEIHYFAFLLPGLFLLGGLSLQALVQRWPAALPAVTAGLAALLLVQLLSFRYFLSFLQSHDVSTAYGVPLAYQQQVVREATELAAGDRIVVATADRDQLQTSRYLLQGQPNLETDATRGLVLPGAPRAVYVTLGDSTPAAEVLRAAEVPRRIIPLPGSNTFRISVLDPT
ncbi:MAG: ArnT family glycosyltransferase, partial [Chloroflexota bacterium]